MIASFTYLTFHRSQSPFHSTDIVYVVVKSSLNKLGENRTIQAVYALIYKSEV